MAEGWTITRCQIMWRFLVTDYRVAAVDAALMWLGRRDRDADWGDYSPSDEMAMMILADEVTRLRAAMTRTAQIDNLRECDTIIHRPGQSPVMTKSEDG